MKELKVPGMIWLRAGITAITFFIVAMATTVWFSSCRTASQEIRLIIPKANWVPHTFMSIGKVNALAGQPDLRSLRLMKDDMEIRVWLFSLKPVEGVMLRRTAGQWSAAHLKGDNSFLPEKVTRRELPDPGSGWLPLWQELEGLDILRLPDSTEIDCDASGIDGWGVIVETNTNLTYRAYAYSNPPIAKCAEAGKISRIVETLIEEFGIRLQ